MIPSLSPALNLSDEELQLLNKIPQNGESIGNRALMRALGWNDEKYYFNRSLLITKKLVETGKGKGGSVRLRIDRPTDSKPILLLPFGTASNVTLSASDLVPDKNLSSENIEDLDAWTDILVEHLLSRGSLSKEEVLEILPDADSRYEELRDHLCDKFSEKIEVGSRGSGGFRLRDFRLDPGSNSADSQTQSIFASEWERNAAQRLSEILDSSSVKELCGDLGRVLRYTRDHKPSKDELIQAMIIQYGTDLLRRHAELRRTIGKKLRILPPERWHPGSPTTVQFIENCRLPRELAGVPSPDRPEDFEYVSGRVRLPDLTDFQMEISAKVLEGFYSSDSFRAVVALPTGAGKTRVAVESIHKWVNGRSPTSPKRSIVWLAHTEELCDQAYTQFKQVWEALDTSVSIRLVRFWGAFTSNPELKAELTSQSFNDVTIFVSTPMRLMTALEEETARTTLSHRMSESVGLLVIDEAHRAAADSYTKCIEMLLAGGPTRVLGLTATPFRQDYFKNDPTKGTENLAAVFNETLITPDGTLGADPLEQRRTLQERKILSRPEFHVIPTRALAKRRTLKRLDSEDATIDKKLSLLVDTNPRRAKVLEVLRSICSEPNASILYFGPTVKDAELMAFHLREYGISAAVISAESLESNRRATIDQFKKGQIKVLCNCEVLTTGFDAPRVTHVVIARPTMSQVLYEQMIGRGLRGPQFGGTEICQIYDCDDGLEDAVSQRFELGYKKFQVVWGKKD